MGEQKNHRRFASPSSKLTAASRGMAARVAHGRGPGNAAGPREPAPPGWTKNGMGKDGERWGNWDLPVENGDFTMKNEELTLQIQGIKQEKWGFNMI